MTLIATHITRFGVIHLSDSNLTSAGFDDARQVQKIFRLPHLPAAVAVAGRWQVGMQEPDMMEDWMPNFIESNTDVESIQDFAERLRLSWDDNRNQIQRADPCWAHIAGYQPNTDNCHPEFWAVSHVRDQPLGSAPLLDIDRFHTWEDFSRRDCREPNDVMTLFANGSPTFRAYANGYAEARQCYLALVSRKVPAAEFDQALRSALRLFPERLRLAHLDANQPLTDQLPELTELLLSIQTNTAETQDNLLRFFRDCMSVVVALFRTQVPPIVGGDIQMEFVTPPGNVVESAADCPVYPG